MGIVVVAACDLDTLMVSGIEGIGRHVVSVGRLVVGNLHGGDDGIERHVAFHLVGHLHFLAALGSIEPAAEHHAIQQGDVLFAKGKLADGLLTLHLLDTNRGRAVGVEIGQGELCIQLGNLVLSQGTYGHERTIVHAGDGEGCGLAGVVEHVHIIAVVFPAAGR